jgi:hypothetical protein
MTDQITPVMLTIIKPAVFNMIPSMRFKRALIDSYRNAQTSSCVDSRASVESMVAMLSPFFTSVIRLVIHYAQAFHLQMC